MASASILMSCLLAVAVNVALSSHIPPRRTVCPMPRPPPPPPPPIDIKPSVCEPPPVEEPIDVKPSVCEPPPVEEPMDVCEQPKVVGMCKAYVPSFYFNSKTGKCEKFIYGGCGGNGNRFPTFAACEKKCVPDVCELPKESGRCRAYMPRFFFNSKTGKCEKFIYGGCGGNGNRFHTKADCEKKCGQDVCELPKESGMCRAFMPRFYFNSKSGKCEEFIYGGCGGNANRFTTKAACEKECGHEHELVASVAQLPPVEYMEHSSSGKEGQGKVEIRREVIVGKNGHGIFMLGKPLSITRDSVKHHKVHHHKVHPEVHHKVHHKIHHHHSSNQMGLNIHREIDPINGEVKLDIGPEFDDIDEVSVNGEPGKINFFF